MGAYGSIDELAASGHHGTCWMACIVVFDAYENDDGTMTCEAVYWDDGRDLHPFERIFDDYEEAKAYAAGFDAGMAAWAHANGNGPEYQHVSVDVVEAEFDGNDMGPGDARCMFEWWDARNLEVVEFDDGWTQIVPNEG